jgi:hypothetical protein
VSYETEARAASYLVSAFAGLTKTLIPDLFAQQNHPEVLLSLRAMRTSSSALRILLHGEPVGKKPHPQADLASAAALARMAIETTLVFFFLCIDSVSPEERRFRRLASMLHHGNEMLKLQRDFGMLIDSAREHEVSELRKQLVDHPVAAQLPPDERKRAIAGNDVIYVRRTVLAERMGLPAKRLDAIYRVFSGYVHSNTLSLHMDLTRYTEPSALELEAPSVLFHFNTFIAKHGLYLLDLFRERELEHPPDYVAVATMIAQRQWDDA